MSEIGIQREGLISGEARSSDRPTGRRRSDRIVGVGHASQLVSDQAMAAELTDLSQRAREGKLKPIEMQGGCFSISSLGGIGGTSFTPIINAPQAGILGVNRIYDGLAWDGDTPIKQKTMRLSLTWDHRINDGAPAAHFLVTVRDLLQAPYRLLV